MTTVYSCIALQPSLQPVDPSTARVHCVTPAVDLYSYTALYSLQLYSAIQSTALYTPPQLVLLVRAGRPCRVRAGMSHVRRAVVPA